MDLKLLTTVWQTLHQHHDKDDISLNWGSDSIFFSFRAMRTLKEILQWKHFAGAKVTSSASAIMIDIRRFSSRKLDSSVMTSASFKWSEGQLKLDNNLLIQLPFLPSKFYVLRFARSSSWSAKKMASFQDIYLKVFKSVRDIRLLLRSFRWHNILTEIWHRPDWIWVIKFEKFNIFFVLIFRIVSSPLFRR